MIYISIFSALIAVIAVAAVIYMVRAHNQNFFMYLQNKDTGFLKQFESLTSEVNKQMGRMNEYLIKSSDVFDKRLEHSGKVLGDLQRNLGEISQVSQRIFDVGKDISSLQEILKSPKSRGVLGEVFLEELLADILPAEYYRMQYMFSSGEKCDAVVFLKDKILSIDSKFPLDNFKKASDSSEESERLSAKKKLIQDVKKHIDSISYKYVRPHENTLDCAFMYIPAENIYYELFIKPDEDLALNQYAFNKKIIPVSPNTFYAFLQLVLFGLKGLQIENNARYILDQLTALRGLLARFTEEFSILGSHVIKIKNKYDDSDLRLRSFREQLEKLGDKSEYTSEIENKTKVMP